MPDVGRAVIAFADGLKDLVAERDMLRTVVAFQADQIAWLEDQLATEGRPLPVGYDQDDDIVL